MKISFSICPISDPDCCRIHKDKALDILKECDLVFSVKGAKPYHREKAKELLGDKYIPLNKVGGSGRIVRYIKSKFSYYDDEREELETIYQSLPKGVELELYDVNYFENVEYPPTKVTLPL